MKADIAVQDRFYRRGLVLGFTLAEVAILIIFALLLALAWHVANKEKEITTLNDSLVERDTEANQLREQRRELEARLMAGDNFDDFFRELELAKAQLEEERTAKAALREKVATMEAEARQMEERARAADKVMETLADAGVSAGTPEGAAAEAASKLERLAKIEAAMAAGGHGEGDAATLASEMMARLEQAERLAERQAGQMSNLKRKLGSLGRGMEMPSCWASPETGKAEYIFGVALTSNGIIVRDNALPHRRADQAELPLADMVFGEEVTLGRFLTLTRPIRAWSDAEGCRFYVGVYDLTGPGEKLIYKRHLRTVGDSFYYYEYRDEAFEMSGG